MAIQTARVTFLTSPDFKAWLVEEARKADVSVSEFIRLRCQNTQNAEELVLSEMAAELKKATKRARTSLDRGLKDAQAALKNISKMRGK